MGKREVRVIVVSKRVSLLLVILTTAAMIALFVYLQGRAYATEAYPLGALLEPGAPPPRHVVLAGLMPLAANILLFMPWGFLVFVIADSPERRRLRAYLITVALGVLFAAAVQLWQRFLPTRVIAPLDIVANTAGVLGGAFLGHLRKRIYIRFDR
jgi:VanZ family protein